MLLMRGLIQPSRGLEAGFNMLVMSVFLQLWVTYGNKHKFQLESINDNEKL